MKQIAICDDDLPTIEEIKQHILELDCNCTIHTFSSVSNFCDSIANNVKYDIIFMDIEIDDENGVDAAYYLRKFTDDSLIIFVSAYTQYWKQLFDVQPFNFITKPIDWPLFNDVCTKAIEKVKKQSPVFSHTFGKQVISVPVKDIYYAETDGKKISLVTKDDTIIFYCRISMIHDLLKEYGFVMINQSVTVNAVNVTVFSRENVRMKNSVVFDISRRKKKEVFTFLGDYMQHNI